MSISLHSCLMRRGLRAAHSHQAGELLPVAKGVHNWAHRRESMKPGFPYKHSRRCRYKICEFHLKVHFLAFTFYTVTS